MTKSNTQWVTIPEETIHTPVSAAGAKPRDRKKADAPVQHKFFWGVGFVVVIIVSFAMLAPQQFGAIVQGNLFDAPGVDVPKADSPVSPLSVLPAKGPEAAAEADAAPVAAPVMDKNETVVQPETAPVTIAINPVSTPKETVAETASTPVPAAEPETAEQTALQQELDQNKQLLEELKKQVADLKTAQNTDLRSAAPSNGQAVPVVSSTVGTAATAAVGQSAVAQPNYRLNTHRVAVTPQAVLQQNLTGGAVYQSVGTSSVPTVGNPSYSANLTRAQGTPESGPREVMAIAFLMTFFALLGWKARRLSRA